MAATIVSDQITRSSLEVSGPLCRVYPQSIPYSLQVAIRNMQIKAAKLEFTRAREGYRPKTPSKRFEESKEWKELTIQAKHLYERACHKCGSKRRLTVDHIKPKSRYPELSLDIDNLQILCWPCNKIKSYIDETDYRQSGKS